MGIEVRPITQEHWEPFARANSIGFGFEPKFERMEDTQAIFELERSLAAFEGEEIVGTTSIFSWDLTVPGASLPAAGVTWVSVKPTHRRRGALTAMMRRQLDDIRERGEALAALWASESVIYSRFGYGLAAEGLRFEIEREHTRLARHAPVRGRCRLVDIEEALRTWPQVYDRVLAVTPGMYSRSETWWKHKSLSTHDWSQSGFGSRFYVQYEEDGEPLGYARYRIKGDQQSSWPNGTLAVQELMAATEGAYAGLWQYLFGVDLVGEIHAQHRRVDEPLFWMLADPRRLVRRPYDTLWVRLVDLPAALEGRRYAAEGRVVLDVRDEFCPWNQGRYELEAGRDGARCKPSTAEPDVSLSAADLGAVYLGGPKLTTLHGAGRVQGAWPSLRDADALFAWDPEPWCPEVF